MGWLRSVGSIKLQVSFAKYRLFYRALLQKKPINLLILLTKATPYTRICRCVYMLWGGYMYQAPENCRCLLQNIVSFAKEPYKRDDIQQQYFCGVATCSRLLKIVGVFCTISSLLQSSFAKETYDFKEPTNRSHPIHVYEYMCAPLPSLKTT